MQIKVAEKLHNIASQFIGQKLQNVAFLKKTIKEKDILVAELTFVDEVGTKRIAVLALDKDLTEGDYKEIVEKILR